MPKTKEDNSGYKVVGVTTPTQVVPDAEMITRDDLEGGRWTIRATGHDEAKSDAGERSMFVPTYDDEHSRHIRAQQMFYAKCSPTEKQWEKVWGKRKYATDRALLACEVLRITHLMSKAGFSPEQHLQRGSELLDGKLMSQHNDFQSVVLNAIATKGTLGYEPFLEGVSQHHPEWIPVLDKLANEATEFYNSVDKHNAKCREEGTEWRIIPEVHATGNKPQHNGFGYTEKLAKWVEQVVGGMTEEGKSNPSIPKPEHAKGEEGDEGKKGKKGKSKEAKALAEMLKSLGEAGKEQRESQQWGRGNIPRKGVKEMWEELRVAKPPLVRSVIGAIGKKRVASATGRNPRRMSRLLTDPERRIFDRTVKGAGGVVLVDTSGSMRLSADQVKEIVLHAPSALVAMYSGGAYKPKPNLWVIANKGRMVEQMPRPNGSNGMDYPALEWAVKQRQRPSSPVIWVSDGGVTGRHDAFHDDLVMECVRLCKKQGVYVVPDPDTAIDLLKRLQRREKVTSIIPETLSQTYKEVTGQELVLR